MQPHTDSDSHVDKRDMWDVRQVGFYCHLEYKHTHTHTQNHTHTQYYILFISEEVHSKKSGGVLDAND